jgi:hypothetical protein
MSPSYLPLEELFLLHSSRMGPFKMLRESNLIYKSNLPDGVNKIIIRYIYPVIYDKFSLQYLFPVKVCNHV